MDIATAIALIVLVFTAFTVCVLYLRNQREEDPYTSFEV